MSASLQLSIFIYELSRERIFYVFAYPKSRLGNTDTGTLGIVSS